MFKRTILPCALLAVSATTTLNAGNANALLLFEYIQQASDVALNVSGSLSGLPAGEPSSASFGSVVIPFLSLISTGDIGNGRGFGISGPSSFGSGSSVPLSYTGDLVVMSFGERLILSSSYIQGDPITGTGLISGQTLASLGLSSTSGLLGTWTVGSDSIEVWAGAKPAATVPGPLPLFGAGAAFAFSRRLRARLRQGSSSPLG